MTTADNRKVFVYSSVFIALLLNIPKLFALRKNGILAQVWHFNLAELILQTILNLVFCLCIFFYSTNNFKYLFSKDNTARKWKYIIVNLLLLASFTAAGVITQRMVFEPELLPGGGVMLRLVFSFILIFIELRTIYLVEESKTRELENEQLRNENLKAGIELLKAQLNPHFFFNALSSLSAIVRENPALAQTYINHLSKIFRYSLHDTIDDLVPLEDELNATSSYCELMKMRYENGLQVNIQVAEKLKNNLIPHMSLQPLIENAVKHNSISASKPLYIIVTSDENHVAVTNNLNPVTFNNNSPGIGLANLNERYKLLLKKEIEIIKTEDSFTVRLPLS